MQVGRIAGCQKGLLVYIDRYVGGGYVRTARTLEFSTYLLNWREKKYIYIKRSSCIANARCGNHRRQTRE